MGASPVGTGTFASTTSAEMSTARGASLGINLHDARARRSTEPRTSRGRPKPGEIPHALVSARTTSRASTCRHPLASCAELSARRVSRRPIVTILPGMHRARFDVGCCCPWLCRVHFVRIDDRTDDKHEISTTLVASSCGHAWMLCEETTPRWSLTRKAKLNAGAEWVTFIFHQFVWRGAVDVRVARNNMVAGVDVTRLDISPNPAPMAAELNLEVRARPHRSSASSAPVQLYATL